MWAFVMLSYIRHQNLTSGFPATSEHPEKYTYPSHSQEVNDQNGCKRIINKNQDNRSAEGAGRGGYSGDSECPENIVWVIEQWSGSQVFFKPPKGD